MSGIEEFLRARLDEDEQVARAAIAGPWAVHSNGEVYAPQFDHEVRYSGVLTSVEHLMVTQDREGLMSSVQEAEAEHIARHDPARVLAEVAAKRRIVGLHEHKADSMALYPNPGNASGLMALGGVLRLLALPYADHPDYDESWRPS